jgi:hypothetical protein
MRSEDYREGFQDGWETAYARMEGVAVSMTRIRGMGQEPSDIGERATRARAKRRIPKQSPKQKLLTQMTKKKCDKYKKGRGKKTYVQIRAEVSRSQAFKKKAKRL